MAILTANLSTLNTAIDSLHTALETVLDSVADGEELIFTEDAVQDENGRTVRAHGVRRIVAYPATPVRPEAAGYLANSLDSMRNIFGEGVFSSSDAS